MSCKFSQQAYFVLDFRLRIFPLDFFHKGEIKIVPSRFSYKQPLRGCLFAKYDGIKFGTVWFLSLFFLYVDFFQSGRDKKIGYIFFSRTLLLWILLVFSFYYQKFLTNNPCSLYGFTIVIIHVIFVNLLYSIARFVIFNNVKGEGSRFWCIFKYFDCIDLK